MSHPVDQANTLRKIMLKRREAEFDDLKPLQSPISVFTIASGKGGVGKTVLTANLGAKLAREGHRVLLVDGDLGLANLDIILGAQAFATLEDVLDGRAQLHEAILGIEPNLWLIPAGSGLMDLRESGPRMRAKLAKLLENCPWDLDMILMDVGAGIQQNVLSLHHPSYESVVILTPEPTSLTDGYSLIKLLRNKVGIDRVHVIVNQVADGKEAQATFHRLKDVAARFVNVQLDYLGHVNRDEKITQSVMKRKILLDLDSEAPSLPCFELLSKRFKSVCADRAGNHVAQARALTWSRFKDEPVHRAPGNTAKFWQTLLGEVKA